MKKLALTASLLLALLANTSFGGTIKLPDEMPAATVSLPDDWEPEEDENGGVLAESPDNVTTIYFDIVSSKDELDETIGESLKWLMEDHEVEVQPDSKKEKEVDVEGRKFQIVNFAGNHKEWGAATVGFFYTPVGQGKGLLITYWMSEKNSEKSIETLLTKILPSVKNVE